MQSTSLRLLIISSTLLSTTLALPVLGGPPVPLMRPHPYAVQHAYPYMQGPPILYSSPHPAYYHPIPHPAYPQPPPHAVYRPTVHPMYPTMPHPPSLRRYMASSVYPSRHVMYDNPPEHPGATGRRLLNMAGESLFISKELNQGGVSLPKGRGGKRAQMQRPDNDPEEATESSVGPGNQGKGRQNGKGKKGKKGQVQPNQESASGQGNGRPNVNRRQTI